MSETATIGVWPKPLKDEPLYSILARLRVIMGLTNQGLLDFAFSGSKITQVDIHLPDRLANLRIGGWVEAARDSLLIQDHTSLPYLAWFLSGSSAKLLRERLAYQGGALTKPRAFSEESAHKRRNLTFCPECREADIESTGMAGWRRVHQLPGVFLCPWHEVALRSSWVQSYRNAELVICSDVSSRTEIANPLSRVDALEIAKISLWLLSNTAPTSHPDFRGPIIKALLERDFANHQGQLNGRFWDRFVERFTLPGMEALRWTWDKLDYPDIPSMLWQRPNSNEIPIRLIALMVFLDLRFDSIPNPEECFNPGIPENHPFP